MRSMPPPLTLAWLLALSMAAGACSSDRRPAAEPISPASTAGPSSPAPTATTTTITTITTTSSLPATTGPAPTTTAPATTVAPATTAPATTAPATTIALGASLSLRSDGIADARFGTEPDAVVSYISGVLGAPARDSGWVDAISRTCPGTEVRFVRWGDLTLLFGDESSVSSGRRHFFSWSFGPAADVRASPAGLVTPEGIGIASSVSDIGRAYPNAVLFEGDELTTPSALINENLFAFITGTADSGVITAMIGGQGCGE